MYVVDFEEKIWVITGVGSLSLILHTLPLFYVGCIDLRGIHLIGFIVALSSLLVLHEFMHIIFCYVYGFRFSLGYKVIKTIFLTAYVEIHNPMSARKALVVLLSPLALQPLFLALRNPYTTTMYLLNAFGVGGDIYATLLILKSGLDATVLDRGLYIEINPPPTIPEAVDSSLEWLGRTIVFSLVLLAAISGVLFLYVVTAQKDLVIWGFTIIRYQRGRGLFSFYIDVLPIVLLVLTLSSVISFFITRRKPRAS